MLYRTIIDVRNGVSQSPIQIQQASLLRRPSHLLNSTVSPPIQYAYYNLRMYYTCVRELESRASQVVDAVVTTEAVRPVALTYFLDHEYLEGLVALGFIPSAGSYDELEDGDLRIYVEELSKSSKMNITADTPDRLVKK